MLDYPSLLVAAYTLTKVDALQNQGEYIFDIAETMIKRDLQDYGLRKDAILTTDANGAGVLPSVAVRLVSVVANDSAQPLVNSFELNYGEMHGCAVNGVNFQSALKGVVHHIRYEEKMASAKDSTPENWDSLKDVYLSALVAAAYEYDGQAELLTGAAQVYSMRLNSYKNTVKRSLIPSAVNF